MTEVNNDLEDRIKKQGEANVLGEGKGQDAFADPSGLYPKTDYMAKYLETEKQRVAWLKIYKTMQFNYHFGFVLGLVGMFFVARAIC